MINNHHIKMICTSNRVLLTMLVCVLMTVSPVNTTRSQVSSEVIEIHFETENFSQIEGDFIAEFEISSKWSGIEVLDQHLEWQDCSAEDEIIIDSRPSWFVVRGIHSNSFLAQTRIPAFRIENGITQRLVAMTAVIAASPAGHSRVERNWPEHSVLSEGSWLRFGTTENGIHKIDYSDLVASGIDPDTLDFSRLQLYGSGGRQLPFENDTDRPLDLPLISIETVGESDGSFDATDAIYFHASGVDSWSYNDASQRWVHELHAWSDSAFYFLRLDGPSDIEGSRISVAEEVTEEATEEWDSHWAKMFHEVELVNIAQSGREFYGEHFTYLGSQVFGMYFNIPNLVGDMGYVDARIAGRTLGATSDYGLLCNGETASTSDISLSENSLLIAQKRNLTLATSMSGDGISVEMSFTPGNTEAQGWIDYVRVQARQSLVFESGQFHVNGSENISASQSAGYTLSNAGSVESVWDVTDPLLPRLCITETIGGDVIRWEASRDTTRKFVAFRHSASRSVLPLGSVDNLDVHSIRDIDLVILTTPFLDSAAYRLATLHANEGMRVAVVNQREIFNAFSSGSPDPTALKMFMMMLRDRAETQADEPKYLQLMGDGTYFNRNLDPDGVNLLTFQSANSESTVSSYVTDDYFGLIEDGYGEAPGDKLAIGVGRIPAPSLSDALAFVSKVETYLGANIDSTAVLDCHDDGESLTFGDWRNKILFVTDDQDGNNNDGWRHMSDSEIHSARVIEDHNEYDVIKIYPDSYVQEATPGGERYDEAEAEISRKVEEGALIVDYIGHGGARGWAHERILNTTTIREWTNKNRLPVFMTATCELSRYDDPEVESAGEMLIFNPNGGAVGMLTTTRTVFSGGNQELNTAFFQTVLDEDEGTGLMRCLGDICKDTKNSPLVTSVTNMRNFSLLGDPAMRLAYPEETIYITELPDTVKSLDLVTISGYVGNSSGDTLTDFNGFIYPKVFDKRLQLYTLDNDEVAGAFSYSMFRSVIHKGLASVENGEFTFQFVVPRDIDYTYGAGRISCYALSGDVDAHGATEDFIIGGTSEDVEVDNVGPTIELYMNDSLFVSGGITGEDPWLYARVYDESGINTVGNGIGHDLKAVLDGAYESPFILNGYFEADLDTYKSGTVLFPFRDMEVGAHSLEIKVWDVRNNSALATTEFLVVNSLEVALDKILAYPNPASSSTTFRFSHNQECNAVEAVVAVFDSEGRQVRVFKSDLHAQGSRTDLLEWDLTNDNGSPVPAGIYIFKVQLTTISGASMQYGSKLVVVKP